MNRFATTCALAVGIAEASIFWEQLDTFLLTKDLQTFEQVLAWQIAGLVIPLLAGPMRVVANIFWTVNQG